MIWRRLRPGELDHEALWLAVSVAAFFMAGLWFRLALPTPECTFHRVTGWACPTCGITRCIRYVLQFQWHSALGIYPLGFLTLGLIAAFNLYAATVLALRLPRLRFDLLSPRARTGVRYTVIAAIAANWGWLLWIRL